MIVKKPIDQLNEKLDKLQKSIDVELEINANDTHIRWRKKDSNTWQDIIDLNSLRGKDGEEGYTPIKDVDYFDGKDGLSIKGDKGDKGEPGLPGKDGQSIKGERGKPGKDGKDGASVELRRTDTHIQWKRTDEKTWHDLIAIEELQGKDGQIIYGGTGNSGSGSGGGIQSIVAGANITVDNTDPLNPVISSASAVTSVNGQTGVVVLDIDDVAPSQSGNAGKVLQTDGTNVSWQSPSGGSTGYTYQDLEYTSTYAYVGQKKTSGEWWIYRRTRATNLMEYATGATDYATNWTNRGSQTYV